MLNELIELFGEILISDYKFEQKSNGTYVGSIKEFHENKEVYSYNLEINLNSIKNFQLPIVIELDNIIPNNLEYHKYTENNAFCFGVGLHERIIFNKMLDDFRWFMESQVKGFLNAYIIKDLTGKWGSEEFSHNELEARKESLQNLLGIYNFTKEGLDLAKYNIGFFVGKCYCGSGKDYTECHFKKLYDLERKISLNDILSEIYIIMRLKKEK